jgi:hypothetical protein
LLAYRVPTQTSAYRVVIGQNNYLEKKNVPWTRLGLCWPGQQFVMNSKNSTSIQMTDICHSWVLGPAEVGFFLFVTGALAPSSKWCPEDPIQCSRRPAPLPRHVMLLKPVFVLMHRSSGPRHASLCRPWPWQPVPQDASHPKITEECPGPLIMSAQGKERWGLYRLKCLWWCPD